MMSTINLLFHNQATVDLNRKVITPIPLYEAENERRTPVIDEIKKARRAVGGTPTRAADAAHIQSVL